MRLGWGRGRQREIDLGHFSVMRTQHTLAIHAVDSWSGLCTQMALPVPTTDISVRLSGHHYSFTITLNLNGHMGFLEHVITLAPCFLFK